jgi:hypothetical protein
MEKISLEDVVIYVEENIGVFHQKRISSLDSLKLEKVLKRKNPYLFKAKHVLSGAEFISAIVDAHISSNEETIFGDWLEGLAIYINQKVYNGRKSGIPGIDLEFEAKNKKYIVTIKSGPNWGNSRQINKMKDDFRTAVRTLRTSNSNLNIICINGCCYGQDKNPDKGNYFKYCGQDFWEFISGDGNLYTEIIEPLGYKAKERNEEFLKAYYQRINVFTLEFMNEYCDKNGVINWKRIVEFNSSSQ